MRVTPRYHYLPEDEALLEGLTAQDVSRGTGQRIAAAANPDPPLDLPRRCDALGPQVWVNEAGLMVYATRLIASKKQTNYPGRNPFVSEDVYVALVDPISGATVHDWIWAEDYQTRRELIWTDELIDAHHAALVEGDRDGWWNQGTAENPVILY